MVSVIADSIGLRRRIRNAYDAYQRLTPAQRLNYKVPNAMLCGAVVPYCYFARRLRKHSDAALSEALGSLVLAGVLEQVPKQEALTRYRSRQVLYRAGAISNLLQKEDR